MCENRLNGIKWLETRHTKQLLKLRMFFRIVDWHEYFANDDPYERKYYTSFITKELPSGKICKFRDSNGPFIIRCDLYNELKKRPHVMNKQESKQLRKSRIKKGV